MKEKKNEEEKYICIYINILMIYFKHKIYYVHT